ncbi:chorismate mutase [Candidatus Poriferisocius sp.]|uniref:chorismate mutase n=1 Tax=Candidatus Poriferisocius sp. TaxID=3101276 RepID=UPI003B0260E8
MSSAVRALRGATTIDADTPEQIEERIIALLSELMDRNDIHHDDLISVVFTATADIDSAFPAAAARAFGLGDVPLLCAQELDIEGGTPLCLRVLVHLNTERGREELHHIYLEGAQGLRDDLPE